MVALVPRCSCITILHLSRGNHERKQLNPSIYPIVHGIVSCDFIKIWGHCTESQHGKSQSVRPSRTAWNYTVKGSNQQGLRDFRFRFQRLVPQPCFASSWAHLGLFVSLTCWKCLRMIENLSCERIKTSFRNGLRYIQQGEQVNHAKNIDDKK